MATKSEAAFKEACKVLPGGVNSPVRAFGAVGGHPLFVDHGAGPYLYDIDGKRYIDYLLSWGPLIWGHSHPKIIEAIQAVASKGTSFGLPTELETKMANQVVQMIPSIESVRMVNSGTEATMSALRLARAYTKRSYIVKFEGCYHGHADSLLVKAGSGVATLGLPDSPGVPEAIAQATLTVPYNDIETLRDLFQKYGEQIAAVIVEPVSGNMGCILPKPGFLQAVRDITRAYDALLIFDEVMTGFRVASGGAQARFGIDPDVTTLGKVIGAGLPVGAYGGKREIMDLIAPAGPVYQAGTLSGNPLAMAAGSISLEMLSTAAQEGLYEKLEAYGMALVDTFVQAGKEKGIAVSGHAMGGMFGLFFAEGPIYDYQSVLRCDRAAYAQFFHALLREGVLLAPSQLEAGFLSAVHGDEELTMTQTAIQRAMMQF